MMEKKEKRKRFPAAEAAHGDPSRPLYEVGGRGCRMDLQSQLYSLISRGVM